MKRTELEKKTKSELFELEARLNDRKRVHSKSKEELVKEKEMVKHVLYECDCCADATNIISANEAGWEYECFVKDCGDKVCRYREDFLEIAEQDEKKIKEMQRNLGMA
ncbi:MAG: hypothetical protein PHQ11_13490 [Paludibacter sp.]|nr:hypothetical protein [Paludibacter sp.]